MIGEGGLRMASEGSLEFADAKQGSSRMSNRPARRMESTQRPIQGCLLITHIYGAFLRVTT